jgi:hypothetical protein
MSGAPGWYPDPAGSASLRRWDGTSWTDELRAAPQSVARAAAGWYGDPGGGAGAMRWWDGAEWTEHVHVPQAEPVAVAVAVAEPAASAAPVEAQPPDAPVTVVPAPEALDPDLPAYYFPLLGSGDVDVDGVDEFRRALDPLIDDAADLSDMTAVLVPGPNRTVAVDLLEDGLRKRAGHLSHDIAGPYADALAARAVRGEFGTVGARIWRGTTITRIYLRLGAASEITPPTLPVPNGAFLGGTWSVVVFSAASYRDRLASAAATGPADRLFSLAVTSVRSGGDTIAVSLDDEQVGVLTTSIGERYLAAVSAARNAGRVPFVRGTLQPQRDGSTQVVLTMPAHP